MHKEKDGKFSLSFLGKIFTPMVPGFIIAGISMGICSLIAEFVPNYENQKAVVFIYTLLKTMSTAFTSYLPAWVGFFAASFFKIEPISGAILGMVTTSEGINTIAAILNIQDLSFGPKLAILQNGSGGVLAILFGVAFLAFVRKKLQRIMPNAIDSILSPLFAFIIVIIPYILLFMPFFGLLSNIICLALEKIIFNESTIIRIFAGYLAASLFLPINMMGIQFAFTALYALQLEKFGSISLYPVLSMAGASQVGASLAVAIKSRMNHDNKLMGVAITGIIPGMLGIGSPLLYGVSIPHIKVFLASCIGAGFGGAYIICAGVSSTGWGASGLLAIPLMTAGSHSSLINMLNYLIGLSISCFFGFLITMIFIKKEYLIDKTGGDNGGY